MHSFLIYTYGYARSLRCIGVCLWNDGDPLALSLHSPFDTSFCRFYFLFIFSYYVSFIIIFIFTVEKRKPFGDGGMVTNVGLENW